MENRLAFPQSGKLRILVVSDPQDLKQVRRTMVEMLDRAYDSLKPDLVIFNGDNILGNHLLDPRIGTFKGVETYEDTAVSMRLALDKILEPVERRSIPFTMVYGNHDDMNLLTKEEQIEIYREYSHCLDMNKTEPSVDCDTHAVELTGSDGRPAFVLYLLDSAWQDKDEERKGHAEVKKETVAWFKKTAAEYAAKNGGKPIPSLVFLHIPLPDSVRLCEKCSADDEGAIKCDDGEYRRLDKNKAKGVMLEPPSILDTDSGLFEAIKEAGGVRAVVTGHDHANCFEGELDGIEFWQTGAASFRCYGNKATRGVRVIDIDESGTAQTRFMTYFDICGETPLSKLKLYIDGDEYEYRKFSILGAALLAGIAGTAIGIIRKKKRK